MESWLYTKKFPLKCVKCYVKKQVKIISNTESDTSLESYLMQNIPMCSFFEFKLITKI